MAPNLYSHLMDHTEEQLTELAFEVEELIYNEEIEDAKEIANKLIAAGKEYGYQAMAMACWAEEDSEMAISWVEKGRQEHPNSWALPMQLANIYSESGKAKEAIKAYEEAAKMEGADTSLIELNKAAAFANAQDFDQALNILQNLKGTEKAIEAFSIKMTLLSELGRFDLMMEIADEELAELPLPKDENQAAVMSEICTNIAKAIWFSDENEEAIKHYVDQAKEYDRTNANICWLQREMDPEFSDDSVIFSLIVEGKMMKAVEGIHPDTREKIEVKRFQNSYMAIADSEEEALTYIFAYESDLVEKGTLKVMDSEQMENEDDEPKGLYALGEMDWVLEDK